MSTFFEKLTGARSPAAPSLPDDRISEETIEPAVKSRPSRRSAPADRSRPTHLAVAEEETPKPLGEDTTEEDDGELTVDIYDRGDAIVIQSTVAGVKPEDLDVSITADTVTIRGKRLRSEEVEEKSYYYKELFWGSFSRTVILPEEIDEATAEAALKNGLLIITLPKKKSPVAQKLKVKVT